MDVEYPLLGRMLDLSWAPHLIVDQKCSLFIACSCPLIGVFHVPLHSSFFCLPCRWSAWLLLSAALRSSSSLGVHCSLSGLLSLLTWFNCCWRLRSFPFFSRSSLDMEFLNEHIRNLRIWWENIHRSTIIVNRQPLPWLQTDRGCRQEDPILPYLCTCRDTSNYDQIRSEINKSYWTSDFMICRQHPAD